MLTAFNISTNLFKQSDHLIPLNLTDEISIITNYIVLPKIYLLHNKLRLWKASTGSTSMCFHSCSFLCLILSLKPPWRPVMWYETGSLFYWKPPAAGAYPSLSQSFVCHHPHFATTSATTNKITTWHKTNIWIQCIPLEQRSHFHANQLSNKN